MTPKRNSTSPIRVTRNAFWAALAASGLRYQNPIRRYEQRPMISQKTRSWRKLSALTVPSIPATKRQISAKYRGFPSSFAMYPIEYSAISVLKRETSASMRADKLSTRRSNLMPGTHSMPWTVREANPPPTAPARRERDRHEREHLPRRVAPQVRGERDEVQDGRVEHDLDGHEDDDGVRPHEDAV